MRKVSPSLLLFLALQLPVPLGAQPTGFRVDRIAAAMFVEQKLNGEKIEHSALEAHIVTSSDASVLEMDRFADQFQSATLGQAADDTNKKMTWITFYTDQTTVNGLTNWKTYRVIYLKNDIQWKRLQK
jgi:hypothetical protein